MKSRFTRNTSGRTPSRRVRAAIESRTARPFETLERRTLLSTIAARHVFYNDSAFDGQNPAATAADDAAIATDKSALRAGGASAFANITSYEEGLNGIMVDIANLPGTLTPADFEVRVGTTGAPSSWPLAPAPSVTVRAGAGVTGSHRVTLTWPNRAILNRWLQVTVKANANTGLTSPDVFYFGNLVGETGNDTSGARINAMDWRRTRAAAPRAATITNAFDFNRDRRVSAADLAIARSALGRSLPTLSPAGPGGDLSFFVPAQTSGETPVTLHPIEAVRPGVTTRVSFGVPFPKGFVDATQLDRVRVLNAAGVETPARVTLLSPWRDLAAGTDLPSVRSALVQVDVTFPDPDSDGDADPLAYRLEWGRTASPLADPAPTDVRANWVQYNNTAAPAGTDYKTADNVFEPPAYAMFTPQWYGQAVLKTRLLPAGSDPDFAGYDEAYANFATTAINEVDPRVTAANLVHYTTVGEPWLFDRATALYQHAFRTGNVKYLRHAHRGAQFYANHITAQGYFDLAPDDLKYVYGEAIATDYWLTGDARLLDVHRRMNPMFDHAQNATYAPGRFFTERHAAYKLLGYVTGYELLGDPVLAQKAEDTFAAYLNHQNNPPAGAPNTGMLMHLKPDHGEGGSNEWIASPWMSVFLVDAVQRYWIHSGDSRVASFVTRMADGINRVGESMYYTDVVDGETHLQPYYLAGPGLTDGQREMDEWGDMEHGVDVSKIFALAYYFTKQAGSPNAAYLGRFNELAETGQAAFDYWTRPTAPASGATAYRLSPARKFNWWFRTTADRDFLLGGDSTPPSVVV